MTENTDIITICTQFESKEACQKQSDNMETISEQRKKTDIVCDPLTGFGKKLC